MAMRRRTMTEFGSRTSGHPLLGTHAEAVSESNEQHSREASILANVLPPDDGKLYHGEVASRADTEPSLGGTCEAQWYAEEFPRRYLAHARPTVPQEKRGVAL